VPIVIRFVLGTYKQAKMIGDRCEGVLPAPMYIDHGFFISDLARKSQIFSAANIGSSPI